MFERGDILLSATLKNSRCEMIEWNKRLRAAEACIDAWKCRSFGWR